MSNELMGVEEKLDKLAPTIDQMVTSANGIGPTVRFPNKEAYLEADRMLAEINRMATQIEKERKEYTAPLDVVKKKIMEAANKRLAPLEAAKETLRRIMGDYSLDEMRHNDRERRRILDEDRKRREEEQLKQAEKAQKQGFGEEIVDKILDKPIPIAKPVLASANDDAVSTRRMTWEVEITDVREFVKAWFDGKAPMSALAIDLGILKKIAVANKGDVAWPGAKVSERVLIGSGR